VEWGFRSGGIPICKSTVRRLSYLYRNSIVDFPKYCTRRSDRIPTIFLEIPGTTFPLQIRYESYWIWTTTLA
jgi:hypothetical protein